MNPQLIQQNQQIFNDAIAKITQALMPLQKLNETPLQIWSIDYRIFQVFVTSLSSVVVFIAALVALLTYLREKKRIKEKSKRNGHIFSLNKHRLVSKRSTAY